MWSFELAHNPRLHLRLYSNHVTTLLYPFGLKWKQYFLDICGCRKVAVNAFRPTCNCRTVIVNIVLTGARLVKWSVIVLHGTVERLQ